MTDEQLIEDLRRAAATWFRNADLLLLEDFIKRFERMKRAMPVVEEVEG